MNFSPIIIIPFYNHLDQFIKFLPRLKNISVDILVSNDGSTQEQSEKLQSICSENNFFYISQDKNQGKGSATHQAFIWASNHNYTHALQIDADGQHDINDIQNFLDLARKNPTAIICGVPVFDSSVPKHRKIGHRITTFWTHIETFSSKIIQDGLCGYRLYPIQSTLKLFSSCKFMRMGFDIEILVRAYWNLIPIINLETRVTYPDTGLSHFKTLKDNIKISLLHSYLVLSSLYYNPRRFILSKIKS